MHLDEAENSPLNPSHPDREKESDWPDHFPSDCPGDRGLPANGKVFQFVRTFPATQEDITSALEKHKHTGTCDCRRASLSCFLNRKDLTEIQNSGGFFASCFIASCNLSPEMGRIEQTGKPSHHSLWLKKQYLPIYLANLEVQG